MSRLLTYHRFLKQERDITRLACTVLPWFDILAQFSFQDRDLMRNPRSKTPEGAGSGVRTDRSRGLSGVNGEMLRFRLMTDVMYHTVMSGSCLRNRGYVSNRDVFASKELSKVHSTLLSLSHKQHDTRHVTDTMD